MQRKNLRPLTTMNMTEKEQTHCDDEGKCDVVFTMLHVTCHMSHITNHAKHKTTCEGDCLGVDLNRNFPSGWGKGHNSFVLESSQPWSSVYKGSHRTSHSPWWSPQIFSNCSPIGTRNYSDT